MAPPAKQSIMSVAELRQFLTAEFPQVFHP